MILKYLLPLCSYSDRQRFTLIQNNLNLYFKTSLFLDRRHADLERAGSKQSPVLMHHLSNIRHEYVKNHWTDPACKLAPNTSSVLDLIYTLNIYSIIYLSVYLKKFYATNIFFLQLQHLITQPSHWSPYENRTQMCAKLGKSCIVMLIQ